MAAWVDSAHYGEPRLASMEVREAPTFLCAIEVDRREILECPAQRVGCTSMDLLRNHCAHGGVFLQDFSERRRRGVSAEELVRALLEELRGPFCVVGDRHDEMHAFAGRVVDEIGDPAVFDVHGAFSLDCWVR